MKLKDDQYSTDQTSAGLFCAVTAYLTWGLSPIYFKFISVIPPFEILLHRIVWSFFLLAPIVYFLKRLKPLLNALSEKKTIGILLITTCIIGSNWFIFIWAVNTGHILYTSLGYYINPLVNVLLGVVFLKERLRRLQLISVILAGGSVLYLTLVYGEFPYISLFLAFSFGFYGLIRKKAPIDSLEGLTVETMILALPAAGYLWHLHQTGAGSLFHKSFRTDLLLMGTSLVTGLPLLLFTMGVRRLKMITMGFLQYIAPSCTFLLAVFVYHESFKKAQLISFGLIWTALAIFSADAVLWMYQNYIPNNSNPNKESIGSKLMTKRIKYRLSDK